MITNVLTPFFMDDKNRVLNWNATATITKLFPECQTRIKGKLGFVTTFIFGEAPTSLDWEKYLQVQRNSRAIKNWPSILILQLEQGKKDFLRETLSNTEFWDYFLTVPAYYGLHPTWQNMIVGLKNCVPSDFNWNNLRGSDD